MLAVAEELTAEECHVIVAFLQRMTEALNEPTERH
jgi:hypothetical protein